MGLRHSVDSAELRAREADARLKDFHKEDRRAPTSVLPSACDAFDEVRGQLVHGPRHKGFVRDGRHAHGRSG